MTDRANKLLNFLGGLLRAYGLTAFFLALLLSAWWGTGHGGGPARSSLGGPFGLLAATGFVSLLFGLPLRPQTNHRIVRLHSGRRRGEIATLSDPDDPHGMAGRGVFAGIALAMFVVTALGPWLAVHGLLPR